MDNTEEIREQQNEEIEEQIIENINPNVSQEMTMDGSYGYGYRSPCKAISSPGQGRTVREYEEQMDALRKENFNLKLKIYVLEEKLPAFGGSNSSEGQESLMKQYLENKVDIEVLKNDLEDKKELLREAAIAINHLENIQKEADKKNLQIVDELKHKIQYLEYENKLLEKSSKSSFMSGDDSKLTENMSKVQELEISAKNSEEKAKELSKQIKKMEDAILKKNKTVEQLETSIQKLKTENSDLKEVVEMKDKKLNTKDIKKVQDDLDKCRSELADKLCELDELQEKIEKRNEEYEKALKYIEKLIKVSTVLQAEKEELKKELDKENESGISNEISNKNNSVNDKKLQNKIEIISKQLNAAKEEAQSKNSLIEKLQFETKQAKIDAEKTLKWSKQCSEVCNILTARLEELAGFLDSLLKNQDLLTVIAPDKKREIQNAVNKSLDLSRSLTAESLSITNLSFDETNLAQLSNLTGFLENTHISDKLNTSKDKAICDLKYNIESCRDKRTRTSFSKTDIKINKISNISLPLMHPEQSEFEVWSEPDRTVSFARIGLSHHPIKLPKNKNESANETENVLLKSASNSSSFNKDDKNKSRTKLDEKIAHYEEKINERDNKILKIQCQLVETDNRLKKQSILFTETIKELEENTQKMKNMSLELETFKSQLSNINMIKANETKLKQEVINKTEEYIKLEKVKDELVQENKETKTLIKNMEIENEEMAKKYEEDLVVIKENGYIQLEELSQEFQSKLNEKIQELELQYQESLKKDYVEKVEYTNALEHTKILEIELRNSKDLILALKETELSFKEQLKKNEEIIQNLEKNMDENLLSMSKANLEKSKITNENLNLEKCIKELMENCEVLRKENDVLIDQLNLFLNKQGDNQKCEENVVTNFEGNERLEIISPDLGIESDSGRTTNDEIKSDNNEGINKQITGELAASSVKNLETTRNSLDKELPNEHKCEDIHKENLKLREKCRRLARMIKDMLKVMKKKNENMEQFERNIMIQIQKTNVVLEYARNNFTNNFKPNNNEK